MNRLFFFSLIIKITRFELKDLLDEEEEFLGFITVGFKRLKELIL
jgi:hypothetical protein